MKTRKNKFSWLFLVAGIELLFVALWQVIPSIWRLMVFGSAYDGFIGKAWGWGMWGVFEALYPILWGLLGMLAFLLLAVTLIVNAFRRLRFLLFISTGGMLLHSAGALGYHLLNLLARQDYVEQSVDMNVGLYKAIPLFGTFLSTDWAWQIQPILTFVAFSVLFLVTILYTIPATRRVAYVWGHVPAAIFSGMFLLTCCLPFTQVIEISMVWGDISLGVLYPLFNLAYITPLPLVLALWFLRWGIREDVTASETED